MLPVRILIADDHPLIRSGLRTLLSYEPDFEVVAEAADGAEAIEAARRELPHVTILDIGLPNLNGIEAARQISATIPGVHLVMRTVHSDDSYPFSAPRTGGLRQV